MILGVIWVTVGFSLYDLITFQEHWPFSHYPMYARLQGPVLYRHQFVALTSEGEQHVNVRKELTPFDESRLNTALFRVLADPGRRSRAPEAMAALMSQYLEQRHSELGDDAQVLALRLERVAWHLDPTLANRDSPDDRQVVLSVFRPPADGGEPPGP